MLRVTTTEVHRVAVLLTKQAAGESVFVGVGGHHAAGAGEPVVADADCHLAFRLDVAHPVAAVAAARQHVDRRRARFAGEPDLDLVRPSGDAAARRHVAELRIAHPHPWETRDDAIMDEEALRERLDGSMHSPQREAERWLSQAR